MSGAVSSQTTDTELQAVAAEIRRLDGDGTRTMRVLRNTFDQLYDGQHTGRYHWEQLYKTEKTHCGTLVEINLQREFKFEDGTKLDYRIANIEVDCKYSQSKGEWMIPPEAEDQLCLLLCAKDNNAPSFSMGVVRARLEYLNDGRNRDKKATLNKNGRKAIEWIFDDAPVPPNVLLKLDDITVQKIMKEPGQQAINELFRSTLCMRVGRAVVATVAKQVDYMKRVRENGGARTLLRSEGIIILGEYSSHCDVGKALEIDVPREGEFVSIRVARAKGPGKGVALIDGAYWKKYEQGDSIENAPLLPKVRSSEGTYQQGIEDDSKLHLIP